MSNSDLTVNSIGCTRLNMEGPSNQGGRISFNNREGHSGKLEFNHTHSQTKDKINYVLEDKSNLLTLTEWDAPHDGQEVGYNIFRATPVLQAPPDIQIQNPKLPKTFNQMAPLNIDCNGYISQRKEYEDSGYEVAGNTQLDPRHLSYVHTYVWSRTSDHEEHHGLLWTEFEAHGMEDCVIRNAEGVGIGVNFEQVVLYLVEYVKQQVSGNLKEN